MKTTILSGNIITDFVQNKMSEGYSVIKKYGSDALDICPNKKCLRTYYYTFIKN